MSADVGPSATTGTSTGGGTPGCSFFPRALDSPAEARRLLTIELCKSGVAARSCDDALVVISELLSNAILHGSAIRSPLGEGLGVDWKITDRGITLFAAMPATGPRRRRRRTSRAARSFSPSRGGLSIVAAHSSDWGITPLCDAEAAPGAAGVEVWATVRR